MLAKPLPQRLVQQVRGGMVRSQRVAALVIDRELDPVAGMQAPLNDLGDMDMEVAELLLRIADLERGPAAALRPTAVALLAASFTCGTKAIPAR